MTSYKGCHLSGSIIFNVAAAEVQGTSIS